MDPYLDYLNDEDLLVPEDLTYKEVEEYESLYADAFDYTETQVPTGLRPSQFVEFAFRVLNPHSNAYEPFSFAERKHLLRMYDTPCKRVIFKCGRQTEKSTTFGNIMLSYSCMLPGFRALYVSSSAGQAKTFSNDRIKEPIETSDVLRRFSSNMLSQNIFEKMFANRSKIVLRYAFLNADRTRGIPATALFLDEIQDILYSNIPVIEQCTSHAPYHLKRFYYGGTPKSLDNTIEKYWSNSTQTEWVIPCDRCGSSSTYRYWNSLDESNIQRKGLSCGRCGELLQRDHPDARWAAAFHFHPDDTPWEGYRISQLMVPWKPWSEIIHDYTHYDRARFYNEVLGISYDTGLRPITRAEVKACCNNDISMHSDSIERFRPIISGNPVFAGIDWGCHDDQTRILTERGFVYFRDLNDEDRVAQWDPDTREMSFVLPKVRTVREWDGELLHFTTRGGLDTMVTHMHRMRVGVSQGERWLTESAGELAQRGGNVKFVGHVSWNGEEQESFVLPGQPKSPGYPGSDARTFAMDDWLELLGYLITEGGVCFCGDRPSCVKMSQRQTVNAATAAKIQTSLNRLWPEHSAFPNPNTGDINWTLYGKQLWAWYIENIGAESEHKRIPRMFLRLGPRQLHILFTALVAGDGYTDARAGSTGGAFYSTSKGLCEDFQEICIKLGLRCIVRLHKQAFGNRKTMWRALWSEGRDHQLNTPSSSIARVPYKGFVYCCAVDTGYIVTERNGCISYQGNTGENSYSVLSLGTYFESRFTIFYIHRFIGEDTEPEPQIAKMIEMLDYFQVKMIGADYGGGFAMNDRLVRKFGFNKVHKWQYVGKNKRKVEWDNGMRRWKVHRTEVMSDIFNAMRRRQVVLPNWGEFETPYADDITNIFSEYNNAQRMTQYSHAKDKPDDSFHSILYCMLASMLIIPRPDIILPKKEHPNEGPIAGSAYSDTEQYIIT